MSQLAENLSWEEVLFTESLSNSTDKQLKHNSFFFT